MKNLINGFIMALSMFTILPVPYKVWKDEAVRHMMKLYPLVGIFVGVINYVVFRLTDYFNLSTILISALTMVTPFIITGMLHLDGFMDVCDALLSRRDKKEKVRILKDPNTGAFSVISLGILFIIDFASTYTLVENRTSIIGIIIIPIISRSLMGIMLLKKEAMKESSLGSYFKKGTTKVDILILYIFLIIASGLFMLLGIKFILVPLAMIIIAILSVEKSIKELGGISGDIAGYGLVLSEVLGILILSII
ncbi:MAG: adenosylcobinamide-GDP ribazoletransferase [Clostridium sp.]|uniref:adenosylcobinamide-GDP ribazoletransferase n=1 Tax=Clostridium sp. TaxID=1506 RepID=UPI002A75276D|nr:adenosylcobinamide-GDP ribazoletransferase [Clostridium sp.]MCI6693961.1 adenosylcobinamide-GDP ribazoletransferase [Clostridium sp.]MDY2631625.1 adenosylcobinamide-GDP ribazoletransferase [Clostridium sp.]MDY4251630.1 adenosylcobinamide-GDP ribazoletransferase [Clostridium sp.]MDY6226679.1 adenosylcobinamide-GDP ribazoletransferase [Clostridium sp.]